MVVLLCGTLQRPIVVSLSQVKLLNFKETFSLICIPKASEKKKKKIEKLKTYGF